MRMEDLIQPNITITIIGLFLVSVYFICKHKKNSKNRKLQKIKTENYKKWSNGICPSCDEFHEDLPVQTEFIGSGKTLQCKNSECNDTYWYGIQTYTSHMN